VGQKLWLRAEKKTRKTEMEGVCLCVCISEYPSICMWGSGYSRRNELALCFSVVAIVVGVPIAIIFAAGG